MKPLLCLLGLHDWACVLPGIKTVTYQGKEWWTAACSSVCQRCGKIADGALLFPAGWDGDPVIVGEEK